MEIALKIFVLFLVLLVVLQYVMIGKARKSNNNKYWIIFFSIIFSVIFSTLFIIFLEQLLTFIPGYPDFDARGDFFGITLGYLLFDIIAIFISIINAIVGIVLKNSQKKKYQREDKQFEKTPKKIIISLVTIIIVLVLYLAIYYLPYIIGVQYIKNGEKDATEYAIDYLEDKYKDGDFKVIRVERDYIYKAISQELIGFDISISSNLTPEIIKLNVKGLNKLSFKITSTNLDKVFNER